MAKAATQMSSFKSILDRPATTVERPKPLPAGTYLCLVKGEPKFDKAETGTEYVDFNLCPQSPVVSEESGENLDVNSEDLTEALTKKSGEKVALNTKSVRARFYLTEDALYRLKEFLEHCGIDVKDPKAHMSRMVHEAMGCQIIAYLRHGTSRDGKTIYTELGSTSAVE